VPATAGVPAPDHARQQARAGRPGVGPAGVGGSDPCPDPLQAVRVRLDLVRGSTQRVVQELVEVLPGRWLTVVAGWHSHSCSRAARRAVMPRAV
jgi:hypothetical protein